MYDYGLGNTRNLRDLSDDYYPKTVNSQAPAWEVRIPQPVTEPSNDEEHKFPELTLDLERALTKNKYQRRANSSMKSINCSLLSSHALKHERKATPIFRSFKLRPKTFMKRFVRIQRRDETEIKIEEEKPVRKSQFSYNQIAAKYRNYKISRKREIILPCLKAMSIKRVIL